MSDGWRVVEMRDGTFAIQAKSGAGWVTLNERYPVSEIAVQRVKEFRAAMDASTVKRVIWTESQP